jgi:hypothetical protein
MCSSFAFLALAGAAIIGASPFPAESFAEAETAEVLTSGKLLLLKPDGNREWKRRTHGLS